MNKIVNALTDIKRSPFAVRPLPFAVRPIFTPFLTGISTKTLWADVFSRIKPSKIAKKPPNTEGSFFLFSFLIQTQISLFINQIIIQTMDSPKYMFKKDFAASINFTKSMFERRSIQINCVLPRGSLCLEMRELWLQKLHEWEHLQVENAKRASELGEMKRNEAR